MGNKPEHKVKMGGISATIWSNEKEGKIIKSITIERNYKDSDGKWQQSNSVGINDLPKMAEVCMEAYRYLLLKNKDDTTSTNN